ncbi:uncharacterized protein LOC129957339 isoform X1 [Argiope bruennichi]|uniref:uncharacterized protein LOC129957339 isoform X1 n=1 Tax=Argiope bruennichi TaxID=94029 RepID=UPI0024951FE0|nr:uncharacterized protein LOC129957339 isoform X1 [Argiope bruennichi]
MALDFSKYYNAHSILQKKLLFQESNAETSFECTLIPGSSKRYENPEFIESCPAILEPSKDKFRSEEEITRNLLEIFSTPPPLPPAFVPALIGSSSIRSFDLGIVQLSNEEQPRATTCCSAVINYYSKSAIAFRNSRVFYIFQFLLSLLPLSAIAMGIKFSQHCSSSFPVLTLIIGAVGAMLVGVWISINIFHHSGKRCTGQQKFLVRMLFGLLAILLSIEMSLYFSTSPSYDPSDRKYCSKTFMDYTFYKYIAIAGSLVLAFIIYIPDFRGFICSFECTTPVLYDQI